GSRSSGRVGTTQASRCSTTSQPITGGALFEQGSMAMEYRDRVLKCMDCGAEFVFTAGEQLFFADKGFKNEPKRCKPCKLKRSQVLSGQNYPRAETTTTCTQCGKE